MREAYPAYQPRTTADTRKLWETCLFAFDASALLDLYRVSKRARNNYLNTLDVLKNRLWIPHQVGLEFYANRSAVISSGLESFEKIPEFAQKAATDFKTRLQDYQNYQWIDTAVISKVADKWVRSVSRAIGKPAREWKKLQGQDLIEERLAHILAGRIGEPFQDMASVYARAEQRINLSIPPGFKERKDDYRKCGDVIIWLQLLDHAKRSKTPIIFITSDAKEDWWLREKSKTKGPRPELIQEMHVVAGVGFYMYSNTEFFKHASTLPEIKPSPDLHETAEELKEVAIETQQRAVPAVELPSVPTGVVLWQFTCPHCKGSHAIAVSGAFRPEVIFKLECHRCGKSWQARGSEGSLVDWSF